MRLPAPERRTRLDIAVAVGIVVVVVVLGFVAWLTSDVRDAEVNRAASPAGPEVPTTPLPTRLTEAWRAPSPATEHPVVLDDRVVTGADGTVTGRDAVSGQELWTYRRSLDLCVVDLAFGRALAVYQRDDGCSEVTSLESDGNRGPQRNSDIDDEITLVSQDGAVAVRQQRYLEMWRSDLVRTLLYGDLTTPVKPGVQPRTDCILGRPVIASSKVAVVEVCPNDNADRITVQKSSPADSDKPEITFSTLLPGREARLVAMTEDRLAVAFPEPDRLAVFDMEGKQLSEYPIDVAVTGRETEVVQAGNRLLWKAGSGTVALDDGTLQPLWTVRDSLGPGAQLGGELVIPMPGGLEVRAPSTGAVLRFVPVDRGPGVQSVLLDGSGSTVFEQRSGELVALR